MSLNTIELPDLVIADLFKNALISDNEKKAPVPVIKAGYKFLGSNRRKITLVVNSPEAVFLPESHLAFITKMLEACKMNLGEVAIVNHASTPVIISELKKQTTPSILLLFGIEPTEIKLPISFPQFKMQAYDGCTYLYTPSLYEIDQNTEESRLLKSKLWLCLQKLFEI
jgi:hypothetical protein